MTASKLNITARPYCAIVTKYLGATNYRPSRVKATCHGGNLTVSWDHSLDTAQNHAEAARQLAVKLEWNGAWFAGSAPGNYVFVVAGDTSPLAAFEVTAKE